MNQLQEKEFELLKIFVSICEKNQLKYYLVCGSALGTVKYSGFIPWDDDIDVALPREDYEKFLKCAQEELPEGIFLQNCWTDPYYPGLGSKLRNSNTTFIEKEAMKIPMNHGIFIDVFPLDGYPKAKKEQRRFEKRKMYYYRRRYTRLIPPLHKDVLLTIYSLLFHFFGIMGETYHAARKNDELNKNVNVEDSILWCNYANSVRKSEYVPKEYYGEGKEMMFENLRVRIPEKYHEYLTQKYGDYWNDIPISEQHPSHAHLVDIDNSYTTYYD